MKQKISLTFFNFYIKLVIFRFPWKRKQIWTPPLLSIYLDNVEAILYLLINFKCTVTPLFNYDGITVIRFSFYGNLQRELIEIEFQEFSRGKPRISPIEFTHLVLRYSVVDRSEQSPYIQRVCDRANEDQVSFLNDFILHVYNNPSTFRELAWSNSNNFPCSSITWMILLKL